GGSREIHHGQPLRPPESWSRDGGLDGDAAHRARGHRALGLCTEFPGAASPRGRLMTTARHPRGPKPEGITAGRVGLYAFLVAAAAFFLLPAYVMLVTSLKSMDEIRLARIFALPAHVDISAWPAAWSSACTGLTCAGIGVGFW